MRTADVLWAQDQGQVIRLISRPVLAARIEEFIDVFKQYGKGFNGFSCEFLAGRLKDGYTWLTDREISLIFQEGLEGRLTKKPPQNITVSDFFQWLNEYVFIKSKAIMENNEIQQSDLTQSADLNETPLAKAINFKITNFVQMQEAKELPEILEKWRDIPIKKLARIIKENIEDNKEITRGAVMEMYIK